MLGNQFKRNFSLGIFSRISFVCSLVVVVVVVVLVVVVEV